MKTVNLKITKMGTNTGSFVLRAGTASPGQSLQNVKNIILQDVNGKELDFGKDVVAPEEIAVGQKVTINGSPANGEFVFADGSTLVIKGGTIVEIIPPSEVAQAAKAILREIVHLKNEMTKFRNEFIN